MEKTTLSEVLAYSNPVVEKRFMTLYGIDEAGTKVIFNSTKKWLWLCYQRRQLKIDMQLSIDTPLIVIDEMWHNFILCSDDYIKFCKHFFGHYINHMPTTKAMEKEFKDSIEGKEPQVIVQELLEKKRWQYEFVYDQLGKEEFLLWYKEYPKKYTPSALLNLALNHQKQLGESTTFIPELSQFTKSAIAI
ncbi:hypothetical protein GCM10007978_12780 [Shewanella hanedai]|jgi:hypothetical protein|uniref:Uncharacterized protein n=1 Tax=Shewanella hanedai TaxID=25 RepID=A0A553JQL6_SHEHA|nr:hypothetical protein [Shewanella hanedai]TRY14738.1 hypothetical protein FN961_08550 [Shewanella hanedai]GGI76585.1 hypothetical protein GCM10007978_12780 [Shewanella hanedai]